MALHVEELHAVLAERAAGRAQALALRTRAVSLDEAALLGLSEAHAVASRIAAAIGAMAAGVLSDG